MPCSAEKRFDIYKDASLDASKILFEYITKENTNEFLKIAKINQEACLAFFYDLNADGENEIIGTVFSSAYSGTAGYSLIILQKNKDNYKEISYLINYYPQNGITILNSCSLGYQDISIWGNKQYDFPLMVKFNKEYQLYTYFFPN